MATQSNDWIIFDYAPTAMDQSDRRANQHYPISLEKCLTETVVNERDLAAPLTFLAVAYFSTLVIRCRVKAQSSYRSTGLFLLDGSIPLKLLMHGNIVRVRG